MTTFIKLSHECDECGMNDYFHKTSTDQYVCEYCDSVYYRKGDTLVATDETRLKKARQNLFDALGKEYYEESFHEGLNADKLADAVRDIQRLQPDDLLARFFDYFLQKENNPIKQYESLLLDIMKRPLNDDIFFILDSAIKAADVREKEALQNAISFLPPKDKELYLQDLERKIEEVKTKKEDYQLYSRDVFICYSENDRERFPGLIEKIVEILEKDGRRCWVAYRNMPKNAENYHDILERAIQRCHFFLVIGSEKSMYSKAVEREILLARDLHKPRQEYKIDDAPHTELFKDFFGEREFAPQTIFAQEEERFAELKQQINTLFKRHYRFYRSRMDREKTTADAFAQQETLGREEEMDSPGLAEDVHDSEAEMYKEKLEEWLNEKGVDLNDNTARKCLKDFSEEIRYITSQPDVIEEEIHQFCCKRLKEAKKAISLHICKQDLKRRLMEQYPRTRLREELLREIDYIETQEKLAKRVERFEVSQSRDEKVRDKT